MWSFLFALFGSIYLLYKYIAESSTKVAKEKNANRNKLKEENFFAKYSVSLYEWERIKNWFKIADANLKHEYYEKLERVGGEITEAIGIEATQGMKDWGYLAKQGKIPPSLEFSIGYADQLSFSSVRDFEYCFYDYTPEERNWFFIKFLKWYDKTMQENGMEYKLLYARSNPMSEGFGYTLSESIGSIEDVSNNEEPFRIVAYWEPLRSKAEMAH